jgi:hypothetical protein
MTGQQLLRQIDVRRTQNGWWQVREVDIRVIVSKRDERQAWQIAQDLEWAAEVLDRHIPKRGQCLLCGVPGEDQTHRVIDAIAERYRAGDDEIDLAVDYGVDVEAVSACLIWTRPERQGRTAASGSYASSSGPNYVPSEEDV